MEPAQGPRADASVLVSLVGQVWNIRIRFPQNHPDPGAPRGACSRVLLPPSRPPSQGAPPSTCLTWLLQTPRPGGGWRLGGGEVWAGGRAGQVADKAHRAPMLWPGMKGLPRQGVTSLAPGGQGRQQLPAGLPGVSRMTPHQPGARLFPAARSHQSSSAAAATRWTALCRVLGVPGPLLPSASWACGWRRPQLPFSEGPQ